MAVDFGKIIDGLKLSYGQLRNLLITSIGMVATVWIVGNKVGSITTKIDTYGETLNEIKKELVEYKRQNDHNLNRIYDDFIEINDANNELWNNKFELLIKYGDDNKEMLEALIEIEDKKHNLDTKRLLKDKNYDKNNPNSKIIVEPLNKKDSVKND